MKRIVLAVILATTIGCGGNQPQQQWAQGYESPNGYMQPDHGYFYYWMLYHTSFGMYQPQPVYHVYVIPQGYPSDYRPWRAREYMRDTSGRFVRRPPSAVTPARSTGGFANQSAPGTFTNGTSDRHSIESPTTSPTDRKSGGFAKPPNDSGVPSFEVSPDRKSGGFAKSAEATPTTTRQSGGFAKQADPSKAASPATTTRQSGGFAKTPTPSARSTGGFSKKK
jgi:hypothetical protein